MLICHPLNLYCPSRGGSISHTAKNDNGTQKAVERMRGIEQGGAGLGWDGGNPTLHSHPAHPSLSPRAVVSQQLPPAPPLKGSLHGPAIIMFAGLRFVLAPGGDAPEFQLNFRL